MSLADEWHDARGPEPPNLGFRVGNAQEAVDFVRRGYIAILDQRVEAAARAAGLDEATIDKIMGRSSSQI